MILLSYYETDGASLKNMDLATVLGGTRGEMVSLVRQGVDTVTDLARRLGVSENAVRQHLLALERDGVVQAAGQRPSSRRPAQTYRLTDSAEAFYAVAYQPVLAELGRVVSEERSPQEAEAMFASIADALTVPSTAGRLEDRIEDAAKTLRALGAVISIEPDRDGSVVLSGVRCPLASLVSECPQACALGVALVARITQASVSERCQRVPYPACRFHVRKGEAA
jgi:predicted ArsR family transcriptional regulator